MFCNFTGSKLTDNTMGSKYLNINLTVEYTEEELQNAIAKQIGTVDFTYSYDLKSLDARQTSKIHWQIRVYVISDAIKEFEEPTHEALTIPKSSKKQRIGIVGSGPAGFFAAEILQKSGHNVTIFERGSTAEERGKSIAQFEKTDEFSENDNYAFGEGGAGTFSDGKLTSRTKGISQLKHYVLQRYIDAGAPSEIAYLSKPHIGSNILKQVVKNLRNDFINFGGTILFQTQVTDFQVHGSIVKVETTQGVHDFDQIIFATGHSAYDSFRMLMRRGVQFETKPFALGVRVEHPQPLINLAMWGRQQVQGLKSAEYALRWQGTPTESAYSFCMCPGGKIVQASPTSGKSIVNGMSNYQRNSPFANAAIVAPVSTSDFSKKNLSAGAMLDIIEQMEHQVWSLKNSFEIPFNTISSFLQKKTSSITPETSYSHGIFAYDFDLLFPESVKTKLRGGLHSFCKKIKGFEDGVMMGLESKTSCAVQSTKLDRNGPCVGFSNVYVAGEGSGFAGGIVSSAVDGIKTAMYIIQNPL
jgi:uncharacterized protein